MSYLLVAGVILALVLWGAPARRMLKRAQWRIGSGALAIGLMAAAAFVSVRGGWVEGVLMAVIGLLLAVSARWPRAAPAPPASAGMTPDEARAMLGVGPQASAAEIRAAYARLMRRAHPDQGGSTGLATQLNLARDRLLRSN
jgi:DnaJ-domain-containing protein 1